MVGSTKREAAREKQRRKRSETESSERTKLTGRERGRERERERGVTEGGIEVGGMDERQMNESLHERNSYRIRETPYEVPATRATRRLIGIRLWQSKQGFL